MGRLVDTLDREPFEKAKEQLDGSRNNVRSIMAQITGIAARFVSIQSIAEDQEDTARLSQRFNDTAAEAKVQIDSLDAQTRQVVDDFFEGLGYTRTV